MWHEFVGYRAVLLIRAFFTAGLWLSPLLLLMAKEYGTLNNFMLLTYPGDEWEAKVLSAVDLIKQQDFLGYHMLHINSLSMAVLIILTAILFHIGKPMRWEEFRDKEGGG